MEIGFGELLLTGILAMVLLKPEDLPMAAKKAAKVYLGIQGFMKKTGWRWQKARKKKRLLPWQEPGLFMRKRCGRDAVLLF